MDKILQVEWRKVCRALGSREKANPEHLFLQLAQRQGSIYATSDQIAGADGTGADGEGESDNQKP